MLYAIIVTGDKQFRVEKGMILEIPLIEEADENSTITFDKVLLCSNGEETAVGTPLVDGALVKATCLGDSKGDKLFVFKIKKRKKYRKKTGHRQKFTSVKIDDIVSPIKDNAPTPPQVESEKVETEVVEEVTEA